VLNTNMDRLKTYNGFPASQRNVLESPGNHPFEPRWMFRSNKGDIYYQKWCGRKALKINHWRCYVIIDGETRIVNVKDLFGGFRFE